MAAKRDYYEVLGVSKDASEAEIKSAYRKKAKECHPDLHPDDKEAEARFKELNEANEVLSDPEKRARYDQFGFDGPNMGSGGNPFEGFGGFGGVEDIFSSIFGGMGGMGGQRRTRAAMRGGDVQRELRITFEEAASGCKKTIEFSRNENCETCGGSGAKPGTSPVQCATCRGTGQVRTNTGWLTMSQTCPDCRGAGSVIRDKCTACGGTGRIRKNRTATITIPAGMEDGLTLVSRGNGEPGRNGGPSGDLLVTVSIKPHKLFKREGADLFLELPISFTQAALGADLDIPTLEGTVKKRIPEGTQTGSQLRLVGKGLKRLNREGKGDLYVTLQVEVPKRLSERQKDLLRQLEEATTGREYEKRKTFADRVKDLFG